jgi:sugar/nucleoside kinase (ribokinase family)
MIPAITLFELGCNVKLFTLVGNTAFTDTQLASLLPADFDIQNIHPWLSLTSRTWITISRDQQIHTVVQLGKLFKQTGLDPIVQTFADQVDILYLSCEDQAILRAVINSRVSLKIPVVTNISVALMLTLASDGSDILGDLIDESYVLLMNAFESEAILSKLGRRSWFDVLGPNPKEIVITNGSGGGIAASTADGVWLSFESEPASKTECVVGAGDTFNGAFLKARFVERLDLGRSCQFAASVAAKKIGRAESGPRINEL